MATNKQSPNLRMTVESELTQEIGKPMLLSYKIYSSSIKF